MIFPLLLYIYEKKENYNSKTNVVPITDGRCQYK